MRVCWKLWAITGKNVRKIVGCCGVKSIVMKLLSLMDFRSLNPLDIGCNFSGVLTAQQRQERTRALIEVIHNAPALEILTFKYGGFKIGGVEDLHQKLTKLKTLEFKYCHIYTGDTNSQGRYQPPECLRKLVFSTDQYSSQPAKWKGRGT